MNTLSLSLLADQIKANDTENTLWSVASMTKNALNKGFFKIVELRNS